MNRKSLEKPAAAKPPPAPFSASAIPSLSASLGSWYISLVRQPREQGAESISDLHAPKTAENRASGAARTSEAALLFPAFFAAFVGVGAACFALAHFITLGPLSTYLFGALILAASLAFGARCGTTFWRKICGALRWPLAFCVFVLGLSARFSSAIPMQTDGETNSSVAIFVGFVSVLSLLLIGARSGGRVVSFCAPLVPCLSLFGLLCLISVDNVVQICFLVFLFSSLYLLSYDRFLRRVAPEVSLGLPGAAPMASWPNRWQSGAWAWQSVLVSSAWFALFFGGGVLLYIPIQAFIPRVIGPQVSKVRAAAQDMKLSYAGNDSQVEITGGTHTLSDREIMRITLQEGQFSGLWRGKTYEHYNDSRWSESAAQTLELASFEPQFATAITPENSYDKSPFAGRNFGSPRRFDWHSRLTELNRAPKLASGAGRVTRVLERVEPLDVALEAVYSSGLHATQLGGVPTPESDGKSPYLVRSYLVQPHLHRLYDAPGYEKSPRAAQGIHADAQLKANLQLPENEATRSLIRGVAQQIRMTQKAPLDTPHRKVRAIAQYLAQNCLYSLNSPKVPESQDAVAFFLLKSQKGACDMFASSTVLLLREMNVPARLATGFLQSDDAVSPLKTPDERASFLVRERDAHAWVEYYVPEFGWLSFDPTAMTRTVDESLGGQIAQLFEIPEISVSPLWALLPATLALTLWGARAPRRKTQNARDTHLARAAILEAYEIARRKLHGRVAKAHQLTPAEYEAKLHNRVGHEARQEFAALTHLYVAAKYGRTPEIEVAEVWASLERFQKALKR